MGHLYRFRKGWQSEHLAKYILSKFSFMAEPLNVSDDLGSDFFCTLFSMVNKDELLPQNSFVIQIKSKGKKEIDITSKLQYLSNLEIPYFVGIVDKDLLKLTIYSGECISNFFAHNGHVFDGNTKIIIELAQERGDYPMYNFRNNKHILKFPKILEIKADFDYTKNSKDMDELINTCSLMQLNISAKKNGEYIFQRFGKEKVDIYAGPGSAKVFRENFLKRLAEVFYNLEFLYNDPNNDKDKLKIVDEFKEYKQLYLNLQNKYGPLPHYVTSRFDSLNKLTEDK
jgi:hypothetical protein